MTSAYRGGNPGSEAALALGCTCPVIDNHYGEGMPYDGPPDAETYKAGRAYWISSDCPLHAKTNDDVPDANE